MNEQRVTNRLVKTWDKLAELTPPPMFAQFNQSAISDIWQQCAVLEIQPSDGEHISFMFDYIGDKAKELMPKSREGRSYNRKTIDRSLKKFLNRLDESVVQKVTVVNQGSVVNERSKVVKYRICLLPFKDKTDNVTHIVVGFSWIEC